jgi:hypothetical protein
MAGMRLSYFEANPHFVVVDSYDRYSWLGVQSPARHFAIRAVSVTKYRYVYRFGRSAIVTPLMSSPIVCQSGYFFLLTIWRERFLRKLRCFRLLVSIISCLECKALVDNCETRRHSPFSPRQVTARLQLPIGNNTKGDGHNAVAKYVEARA